MFDFMANCLICSGFCNPKQSNTWCRVESSIDDKKASNLYNKVNNAAFLTWYVEGMTRMNGTQRWKKEL